MSSITSAGGGGTTALVTQTTAGLVKSAGQLLGTNTNDDAAAGYVGEYVSSVVTDSASVPMPASTFTSITSITLSAGDWDVSAIGGLSGNGATTFCSTLIGTTVDSAAGTVIGDSFIATTMALFTPGTNDFAMVGPQIRVSITTPTTYYMTMGSDQSGGGGFGKIWARRAR